jgi:alcohol dehydrogenase YqhD (iron-dependent ADH family)
MKAFNYTHPTKILSGENTCSQLASIISVCYKSVLFICTDESLCNTSFLRKIKRSLNELGIGFCEVTNIPQLLKTSTIQQGIQKCIDHNVDCIIALGGASALDAAKLIGMAARSETTSHEYIWDIQQFTADPIPVITVPNLSAAGLEMNNSIAIANDETKETYHYKCHLPTLTVMDPTLTASAPLKLSVCSALDILDHIFKYYFNGCSDDSQKYCFERLIFGIITSTQDIVKSPDNLKAIEELLWCAAITRDTLGALTQDETCLSSEHLAQIFNHYTKKDYASFARFARNVFGVDASDDLTAAQLGIDLYGNWMKTIGVLSC